MVFNTNVTGETAARVVNVRGLQPWLLFGGRRRKRQRRGCRGFQTTTAVLLGTTAMSRR